ncbi:MAG: hypothetical protein PUP92_05815, partial [Rhizonema sp. PD38]|nr:hypothetical protein [Rhizonema sp. PD38]
ALSAIAQAYGKLNQPEKAAVFLDKALASANLIQNSYSKNRLSVFYSMPATAKHKPQQFTNTLIAWWG